MSTTRYTLQWSRPEATDRTRLTRWLDLETHATLDAARDALAQLEQDAFDHGDDGLSIHRIVVRVDTPVAEAEHALDLHVADALEVAREVK